MSDPSPHPLVSGSQLLEARVSATELELPLCVTCSTQTSYTGPDLGLDADDTPYKCAICADPRQFIGRQGTYARVAVAQA